MPESDVNPTFVAYRANLGWRIVTLRRMHAERSHANPTDSFHL